MEPIDAQGIFKGSGYGNWSPGPFRKLIDDDLPWQYKLTPDTLYQVRPSAEPACAWQD